MQYKFKLIKISGSNVKAMLLHLVKNFGILKGIDFKISGLHIANYQTVRMFFG